jgi:hypothetical protein
MRYGKDRSSWSVNGWDAIEAGVWKIDMTSVYAQPEQRHQTFILIEN